MSNRNNVKVSIIVPIYNVKQYIGNCLKSIINQNKKDIEIICVDDGSTDGSISEIREASKGQKNIKIISYEKNEGLSYARNKGLEKARGEYIWFVDPDDEISTESSVSTLYEIAKNNSLDLLLFDAQYEYEDELLLHKYSYLEHIRDGADNTDVINGKELFKNHISNHFFITCVPFLLIKRELLINNNLKFANVVHEDVIFTPFVLLRAKRVQYIKQKHYTYFRRRGSITTSEAISKEFSNNLNLLVELLRAISQMKMEEDVQETIAAYINQIKDYVFNCFYKAITEKKELFFINSESYFLWQIMLSTRYPYISRKINKDFFEQIQKADTIVVYGAGEVSKVVQKLLLDLNQTYYIAVSHKERSNYYEISEIRDLFGDSLILIASIDFCEEMITCARKNGLSKIFVMI